MKKKHSNWFTHSLEHKSTTYTLYILIHTHKTIYIRDDIHVEIECALLCLNLTIDFLCSIHENQMWKWPNKSAEITCVFVCVIAIDLRNRLQFSIYISVSVYGVHIDTHTPRSIQRVELENFQIAKEKPTHNKYVNSNNLELECRKCLILIPSSKYSV